MKIQHSTHTQLWKVDFSTQGKASISVCRMYNLEGDPYLIITGRATSLDSDFGADVFAACDGTTDLDVVISRMKSERAPF